MSTVTYLITGSNKGLGRGIVTTLLLRDHVTVIAAVRDPSHSTATSLAELPRARTARLIVVKIDSASTTDPATIVKELERDHSITALDVVIANAGIINSTPKVSEATVDGLLEHYRINAIAPVMLYQATRYLLLKAAQPKFVVTSGSGGSIVQQSRIRAPLAEYGPSRAALNWLIRKIHFEEERLVAVLVDPGLLDTETGRKAVDKFGMDPSLLHPVGDIIERYLAEVSSAIIFIDGVSLTTKVDHATKDTSSGMFVNASDGAFLEY